MLARAAAKDPPRRFGAFTFLVSVDPLGEQAAHRDQRKHCSFRWLQSRRPIASLERERWTRLVLSRERRAVFTLHVPPAEVHDELLLDVICIDNRRRRKTSPFLRNSLCPAKKGPAVWRVGRVERLKSARSWAFKSARARNVSR